MLNLLPCLRCIALERETRALGLEELQTLDNSLAFHVSTNCNVFWEVLNTSETEVSFRER